MTTRSASRDASMSAKPPVPAATTAQISAPFGATPLPSVAVAIAWCRWASSSACSCVGLQAGLADRAGGDGGHEVGVGDVDARRPGQAQRPAQGGDRAAIGPVVVVEAVDADHEAAHRHAQLTADDDDRQAGRGGRRGGPSIRAAATPCPTTPWPTTSTRSGPSASAASTSARPAGPSAIRPSTRSACSAIAARTNSRRAGLGGQRVDGRRRLVGRHRPGAPRRGRRRCGPRPSPRRVPTRGHPGRGPMPPGRRGTWSSRSTLPALGGVVQARTPECSPQTGLGCDTPHVSSHQP